MVLTFFYKAKHNKKNESYELTIYDSLIGVEKTTIVDDYYILSATWKDALGSLLVKDFGYKNYNINFKRLT